MIPTEHPNTERHDVGLQRDIAQRVHRRAEVRELVHALRGDCLGEDLLCLIPLEAEAADVVLKAFGKLDIPCIFLWILYLHKVVAIMCSW